MSVVGVLAAAGFLGGGEARRQAERSGRLEYELAAATARAQTEAGRVDLLIARLGAGPDEAGAAEPPRSS